MGASPNINENVTNFLVDTLVGDDDYLTAK